jgi:hypothetical protein
MLRDEPPEPPPAASKSSAMWMSATQIEPGIAPAKLTSLRSCVIAVQFLAA